MSFEEFVLLVPNVFPNLNRPNGEPHITQLPDLLLVGVDVLHLYFSYVFLCGVLNSPHYPAVSRARPGVYVVCRFIPDRLVFRQM
jgi:hypothetical protein